jgi:hypothetical protein
VVSRIVEERIAADEGHVAASAAVYHPSFSTRYRATRNASANGQAGCRNCFGQHSLHFVGSLHGLAGALGGADVGSEVNPRAAAWDEVRTALGKYFDTPLPQLVSAGGNEQTVRAGFMFRIARINSSQQAMPPPRSLAQVTSRCAGS